MPASDQPNDASDDRPGSGRTPSGPADDARPVAVMSYEEARDELVQVVARLETGGETLEGSLALWERGEALAARCQEWLDGARERLDAAHRREADASDDRGGLRGDGSSSRRSSGNEPGGDEAVGGRAGADRPGNDGRGGAAAASRTDHDEENR